MRLLSAGSRRGAGPAGPADRMLVVNRGEPLGRAGELWFKRSQHPPRRFVHAITQLHPALVHAHFGMDGSLMLPLSRRLHVPLVVTFHGYDVTMRPDAVPRDRKRVVEGTSVSVRVGLVGPSLIKNKSIHTQHLPHYHQPTNQ